MSVLTEAEEERGGGLVLGHVDQPSAQAEVREDQQRLLDDVVGAADVLGRHAWSRNVVGKRQEVKSEEPSKPRLRGRSR